MLADFRSHLFPYELVITDVDGVLTDGSYQYTSAGKTAKVFGPHDSDGFKLFSRLGVPSIAITADKRGFAITKMRMDDLNIPIFIVPELERKQWVQSFAKGKKYAFIGDGYYDIQPLIAANVGYAPMNAPDIVKANANKVLPVCGGNGVILHVFEHFLSVVSSEAHSHYLAGKF